MREKTGLTPAQLSELGPTVYYTEGSRGSAVFIDDEATFIAPALTDAVDPVGAGDAYRGGLLWALERGLPPVVAARLGSLIAAKKVAVAGPNYHYSIDEARADYKALYREAFPD